MPGTQTRKSACILCYVNCGIEVEIEDGLMKRVRGDKDNPKSLGYICQKAGRLPFYANDRALRLTSPLRRNAAGGVDEISWDVAISEIAAKLNHIRETGASQSFGYYGGGGQGSVIAPAGKTGNYRRRTCDVDRSAWDYWRRRPWRARPFRCAPSRRPCGACSRAESRRCFPARAASASRPG